MSEKKSLFQLLFSYTTPTQKSDLTSNSISSAHSLWHATLKQTIFVLFCLNSHFNKYNNKCSRFTRYSI